MGKALRYLTAAILAASLFAWGCEPQEQPAREEDPSELESDPTQTPEDPGTPDSPDDPDPGTPDVPDEPDIPDGPEPDDPVQPDPEQPDQPAETTVDVLDPGETRTETTVRPQHPDEIHAVGYNDFYNTVQDELDEYGNVDYVISQGDGTAWPLLLDNGHIRFYQGGSKGGGYIRVRSRNGAKILCVKVGSATDTKLAHSLNGKAARSATQSVAAGEIYAVENLSSCTEVKILCMGTTQSERWEMDSIYVQYQGGFVEADFYEPVKEYGPLVKVGYPFTEGFETGFPTTDKPTYLKYGLTAGRENLEWSTWYGSFSWQNPIEGGQSAQLRVYQEDAGYEKEQFGSLSTEFFLKDLTKVSFKYYYTEFWNKAVISYCEFGSTQWCNPQQIVLSSYSERNTVKDFTYILDQGHPHNAKIRIQIDEATGFPSKDHYDFIFDSFVFE